MSELSQSVETLDAVFRAQLILPEQRQLYDYWVSKAASATMPQRRDINPADFPHLLPCISLIEACQDTARWRVRLAGTKLRDIYDRDITGLYLNDLEWGDKSDYWMTAYKRVFQEGKPAQGILRGPKLDKEHMVQYWLKLPLQLSKNRIIALCYDHYRAILEEKEQNLQQTRA